MRCLMQPSLLLRCMLSLVLLQSTLATHPHHAAAAAAAHGAALMDALSQHVGKFGPLGPDVQFSEQLAAAAVHIADADEPSSPAQLDPETPPDPAASEGCSRIPLILMTVADEHAMEHSVPQLVSSLKAIPAPAGSKYPQAPVSPEACACAHKRWQPQQAQQGKQEGKQQGQQRSRDQRQLRERPRRELGGENGAQGDEPDKGGSSSTLATALLVVAANKQAGMLCADLAGKLGVRCYQTSHPQADIGTALFRHHGASLHLAFARARHILNAVTLGYGVMYVDSGVKFPRDPLAPALQRPEDVVHLPAMINSNLGRCSGAGSLSGVRGALLVRPSSAAARCMYDWVVAMRETALREGKGMLAANASIHDQFQAVVPPCLSVMGPGYATVEEPISAECIESEGGR